MSDVEPNPKLASKYVRSGFWPRDRHALFLLHRRSGGVIQRVVVAEDIASEETLQWLARENNQSYEVNVGMNALKPGAQGRTQRTLPTSATSTSISTVTRNQRSQASNPGTTRPSPTASSTRLPGSSKSSVRLSA